MPKQIRSKEVRQAYQELNMINWTEKERKAYIRAEMQREDIKNVMALEKELGFQEGEKRGLEKGKKEGREQGKKEGEKKGEKKAKLAIAKKMLQQKTEIDIIMQFTGLTKTEIMALKSPKPAATKKK